MPGQIVKAGAEQFHLVQHITHETIRAVYPHYYPTGVVEFFLAHHSSERIMADISAGIVYLLLDGDEAAGTVTVKENEICRLFVLPRHQHRGFGRQLMDFAEEMIAEEHREICLDASLPAKRIYLKRGFAPVEAHQIVLENGDVLCYDLMKK